MLMNADEAAKKIGIPAVQLKRWAAHTATGWANGPKFSGTWLNPRYAEQDLDDWKAKRGSANP